jgi:hypothetical protein
MEKCLLGKVMFFLFELIFDVRIFLKLQLYLHVQL